MNIGNTQADPSTFTVEKLRNIAKDSCKDCYGRGFIGYKGQSLVICPCVLKACSGQPAKNEEPRPREKIGGINWPRANRLAALIRDKRQEATENRARVEQVEQESAYRKAVMMVDGVCEDVALKRRMAKDQERFAVQCKDKAQRLVDAAQEAMNKAQEEARSLRKKAEEARDMAIGMKEDADYALEMSQKSGPHAKLKQIKANLHHLAGKWAKQADQAESKARVYFRRLRRILPVQVDPEDIVKDVASDTTDGA